MRNEESGIGECPRASRHLWDHAPASWMRGLFASVDVRHRAAAPGAQRAAAGAGGAAVGALAHPRGPHGRRRAAGIAAAGRAGDGAAARFGHRLERAGGLGEERKGEKFIAPAMLSLIGARMIEVVGEAGEYLEGQMVRGGAVAVAALCLCVDDMIDHRAQ